VATYLTKPTRKQAEKFTDPHNPHNPPEGVMQLPDSGQFYTVTAHGQKAFIAVGDYVVAEPDGRGFYPAKADIFESGHERID
jgi:hypothetical protein